jgi:hypothetical protein
MALKKNTLAPLWRLKLKALLHLGGHAGKPTTASSVPEEKTFKNALGKINDTPLQYFAARTTDAQRGNSLHCTAENSIPIPNF